MQLIELGKLIEKNEERNCNLKYIKNNVKGMTVTKEIIPTKADVKKNELKKFWIVYPNDFIYNPRTHGKKIGLGFNNSNDIFIISWNNIAFHIKKDKQGILDPMYLFIFFNRDEWDKNACFNSWGSSTEVFTWEELCDMKIPLPSIEIQKKYVSIYKALTNNFQVYQSRLDDLKLVCDLYIENLKKEYQLQRLNSYITKVDEKNWDNRIKKVMGVSVYKEFREPTSKVNKNELSNYKIVHPKEISFVQTTHNEKVFAYALNNTQHDIVVTSVNEVIKTKEDKLLPEYLAMFFNRKEFDRYVRFHSWGSARETFTWNDLIEVQIPIPSIEVQKNIVEIYNSYIKRKAILSELKKQMNNICPILIAGAIKEES